MDKITLLINESKDFDTKQFRKKMELLKSAEKPDVLIINYQNKVGNSDPEFKLFSVADHEDVSLTQLLGEIQTEYFLFFNPKQDYPNDFFDRLFTEDEKQEGRIKGTIWEESIIAMQQSSYGLCGTATNTLHHTDVLPRETVLFNKKEVKTLNTDKVSVHPDLAVELYRYAAKKNLNLIHYEPKKEKVHYHKNFADLMAACQQKAQKRFVFFPAVFVLFFIFFGIGASFYPLFMLVFLIGMGAYMLAITLESFGISSIKKNGALLPVLVILFPFVHLVYGLESWIAKFKKKA